ncbi:hypothetical protein KR059_009013, partial [Drosophila kikkawai]
VLKATFRMRCETLLTMLWLNILLANTMELAPRDIDPRHKPGGVFCKANPPSSQGASKEVTGTTAASDDQQCAEDVAGQQVKSILSDRANLACMAADAELAGKEQLLDQLVENLAEARGAMDEVQQAVVASSAFLQTVCRAREKTQQRLAHLQGLYNGEMMDPMRRMVANAQQLVMEKRSLLDAAKCRVEKLHTCLKEAQAVLERNRDNAEKANCSAAEAKKRIE